MSAAPAILSIETDPQAFAALRSAPAFAEIEAHPQTGAYARLYYPAVYGETCRDVSFAVLIEGKAAAIVLCTVLAEKLCLYGLPLRIFHAAGADAAIQARATRTAMGEIDRLAGAHSLSAVLVRDVAGPALSPLGEACLARGARADVKVVAEVDLTLGEEGWRKALRKRYKPLINWGRQNLELRFVNHRQPDEQAFERFRKFHRDVAGRVTRSSESWNAMWEWLSQGQSELVLGELSGELVSANFFVDGSSTSLYMTGVYDRNKFDKPLAHYLMWHSFERALVRGCSHLEIGDIEFKGEVDDKYHQIGYFKRGFATQLATHLVWRWQPALTGAAA